MGSQRVGALKRSIMAQYIMKGGRPLNGEVNVSGAKNAALGILAAAVMTDENVLIEAELKRCADELAACDVSMETIRNLIRGNPLT